MVISPKTQHQISGKEWSMVALASSTTLKQRPLNRFVVELPASEQKIIVRGEKLRVSEAAGELQRQ